MGYFGTSASVSFWIEDDGSVWNIGYQTALNPDGTRSLVLTRMGTAPSPMSPLPPASLTVNTLVGGVVLTGSGLEEVSYWMGLASEFKALVEAQTGVAMSGNVVKNSGRVFGDAEMVVLHADDHVTTV